MTTMTLLRAEYYINASLDEHTQGITKDVFEARPPCGVMDKVGKHQNY